MNSIMQYVIAGVAFAAAALVLVIFNSRRKQAERHPQTLLAVPKTSDEDDSEESMRD